MSPWAKRQSSTVPSISSRSKGFELNDYSLGFNSFISNDKMPVKDGGSNMWRLAQDGRIPTLGEYETRKGFDFHSVAVGEALDDSQTSTTGATDVSFNNVTRIAQQFITAEPGRLPRIDLNLKNDASATGTITVEIWSDSSGSPSVRLARSSIAGSALTSSYSYHEVRFAEAPELADSTAYWIIVYTQAEASGSYKWSSTTTNTDSLTSTNSGTSYTANAYALNFKQYVATDGACKGLYRAYKSDGTKVTLIAHGTTLYKVNDVTGALTAIKTGLSASATHYRLIVSL